MDGMDGWNKYNVPSYFQAFGKWGNEIYIRPELSSLFFSVSILCANEMRNGW